MPTVDTMAADWFRNETWNDTIAQAFEQKLQRSRDKLQYLRIQANTLAGSRPDVALALLERYFELGGGFDQAQAHVDRATALVVQGRVDEALAAYEAALEREAAFPNLLTGAVFELPYLVAVRGLGAWFARASEVLRLQESRLVFPVDHFRHHASKALIAASFGDAESACVHAERALVAASQARSPFPRHPKVGLVGAESDDVVRRLVKLRRA